MKIISFPTTEIADTAWEDVPRDRVIDGAPQSRSVVLHSDPSSCFFSGVYECTAGKWRVSYTEDEFCTLVDGHVRLCAADGTAQEYRAPDSFLIPAGFAGTWEAVTPVRKFFALYEKNPEASA